MGKGETDGHNSYQENIYNLTSKLKLLQYYGS